MQLRHYTRHVIKFKTPLSTGFPPRCMSRVDSRRALLVRPTRILWPATGYGCHAPVYTRTGRVARDVRGFLADPSWFRGAGYARWIPGHPNWMPVTGLIRAASVWSRFDWIGRGGWRARLEILTLPSPPPRLSLHRLCYSLFNRLRLVEPAIPASFDGICFERCCRYFGQDGTLVPRRSDLVYRPFPHFGEGGDWRWFDEKVAMRREEGLYHKFDVSFSF